MSDATERPADDTAGRADTGPDAGARAAHADAWERACAEDLAAERARRLSERGPEPGTAGEELRKLIGAVADKIASFQAPIAGAAAQNAVRQVVAQAKAAVEPVIERNPEVFDHLAAAGSELLAAYRAAVEGQERRWTREQGTDAGSGAADGDEPEGPTGTERIDLD